MGAAFQPPLFAPPKAKFCYNSLVIKLLALDLDGTLVDSAPDLCHCLGVALERIGLRAPTEAQTRSWIGGGVEVLLKRALEHQSAAAAGEAERAEALGAFLACYERNLFVRSRLYPQVPETLDLLARRGILLHCITNKRFAFADALLAQAGIRDRFALVLGGDSLPQKKPSGLQLETAARHAGVRPADALMVGDSMQDFSAARAAGFRFAWASYGYCAELPVPDGTATLRIDRFDELPALLDELARASVARSPRGM
ncbi:MAG TPA: HAD-IA family hydrolase [Gammaproteobacteria bacterium]